MTLAWFAHACSGAPAAGDAGDAQSPRDALAAADVVAADHGALDAADVAVVTDADHTAIDAGGGDVVVPRDTGPLPDACGAAGCMPGVWENVTPAGVSLTAGACGNYGASTVQSDPQRPQDVYALFDCQGIWRSTDYGHSWSGPINTGMNGATFGDCAGGFALPPGSRTEPPTLYASCIRGAGLGFWRSTDGGVSWTKFTVTPGGARQDFYPPVVDPYDNAHLVMAGHEMNLVVGSTDGGATWTAIHLETAMNQMGGTAGMYFVDTGAAATTRGTWIYMAQQSGGTIGTWRTTTAGAAWTRVDSNEHPHGGGQIYQPDGHGVVYVAGAYSTLGWGVLRSSDYGATWTHVGSTGNEGMVFGTPRHVYAMYGWAIGAGGVVDPSLERADPPGTGTWTMLPTPAAMTQGPVEAAVTGDGTYNIVVTANKNAGLWRYVEPTM